MKRVLVCSLAVVALSFGVVALHLQAQEEPRLLTEVSESIAGTWVGVYDSNEVGLTDVTLVFQQLGSTVTGTYLSANGAQGVMFGTLQAGGSGDLTAVQTTPTCKGQFQMPVTVEGDTLTWQFTGHDCLGAEDGNGKASRQAAI